jgi:Flp pilus assembly pilin Flp
LLFADNAAILFVSSCDVTMSERAMKIVFLLQKWIYRTEAATATEYALLAGGVALALVVTLFATGDSLSFFMETLGDSASNANNRMQTS